MLWSEIFLILMPCSFCFVEYRHLHLHLSVDVTAATDQKARNVAVLCVILVRKWLTVNFFDDDFAHLRLIFLLCYFGERLAAGVTDRPHHAYVR